MDCRRRARARPQMSALLEILRRRRRPGIVSTMPRGAGGRGPVTEASAPAPQGRPQSRLRTMWFMLAAVAAPVVILDQASKLYIAAHLRLYESVAIVPHLLDLTYTHNPGAAFSMFTDLP